MSESGTESKPKEEGTIVTCEGCTSKWRLKFEPTNKIVADLVTCPLCVEPATRERNI